MTKWGDKMPEKFGTVWFLLLTIALVYLYTTGGSRLAAAWDGLTGKKTI